MRTRIQPVGRAARLRRTAVGIAAAAGLVLGLGTPAASAAPSFGMTVQTDKGAVQGRVLAGYRTFEGIPYAAPPVGRLRFQPPQPAPRIRGTLDATEPRSQCAQLVRTGNPETFSEDCLYLNVTTPARPGRTGLPVMVWVHGGSFVYGTGANYDAAKLAQQGDVVVVTINYRLGPLGFLAHPALSGERPQQGSGNLALQDQQAALAWVKANAAAFGGNPGNVTLFGESAGAASVCANLVSPASAGLFQRGIAQSYSCAAPLATRAEAEQAGLDFAAAVGCADPATAAACLRSRSSEQLLRAWTTGAFVVGGSLLPLQPAEALRTGRYNRVSAFMHGNSLDDYGLFTRVSYGTSITAERYREIVRELYGDRAPAVFRRYPVAAYPSPIEALARLQSDAGTRLSTCEHLAADDLLSAGTRTYAYQFQDRTSSPLIPALGANQGASHAQELPFLFPGLFGAPLTAEQQDLSNTMVAYWTSFARTGNPNAPLTPSWQTYRTGSGVVQALDLVSSGGVRPVDAGDASNCAFFARLAA
ncbi:MAG TPA: carboxylesterase/lipase family protein [Mycobacteriales bacterium]|nr:carboxylesterase/lipase family protein [Mycobacteriales bacterium]